MKVFLVRKKLILVLLIVIFLLMILFSVFYTYTSVATSTFPQTKVVSEDLKNEIAHFVHASEKIAYLTFDDGPNPSVTPKLLFSYFSIP